MKKTLTLGLLGAALAIGGGCAHHHLDTARQERAEMRQSGDETVASGRTAGRSTAEAARDFGVGVEHGVVAAGHGIVAGARYTEHALTPDRDKSALRHARSEVDRAEDRGERSADRFRGTGRDAVGAARATGSTVYHAGDYAVQTGEHAVGSIRRATGERPHGDRASSDKARVREARGGGPVHHDGGVDCATCPSCVACRGPSARP
jgi:hypothetical protein